MIVSVKTGVARGLLKVGALMGFGRHSDPAPQPSWKKMAASPFRHGVVKMPRMSSEHPHIGTPPLQTRSRANRDWPSSGSLSRRREKTSHRRQNFLGLRKTESLQHRASTRDTPHPDISNQVPSRCQSLPQPSQRRLMLPSRLSMLSRSVSFPRL
jgi:hypothetical protein